MEGCKNDVCNLVGGLAEERNCVLNPDDTRMLWGEVREGAPLRVLVLDLFAFKKTDRLIDTHEDSWGGFFFSFRREIAALVWGGVDDGADLFGQMRGS